MATKLLEGVAVSVLSKYLGKYVEGLDAQNLSLSIGAGDLVLEKLELRRDALAELDLPVTVKGGYLAKVKLKIPWSSIKSQPAIVDVGDLYILAGPKVHAEYDAEAEAARALNTKLKRVALAEMLLLEEEEDPGASKDDSFTGRLIARVMNNLQVYIQNVHFRYEDDVSNPQRPFSFGFTLESFHAITVDDEWEPAYVPRETGLINKLIQLRNFAAYWNSGDDFLQFESAAEMGQQMSDMICRDGQAKPQLNFILHPISGELRVVVNKSDSPDIAIPKYVMNFVIEQVSLTLHETQYADLVNLTEGWAGHHKRVRYQRFRPTVAPKEDPRAWWKYAISTIQHDMAEERRRWTWKYMLQRREQRTQYVQSFSNVVLKVDEQEHQSIIDELEVVLSYEDIMLYRTLARALAKREQSAHDARVSTPSRNEVDPRLYEDATGDYDDDEDDDDDYEAPTSGLWGWAWSVASSAATAAVMPTDDAPLEMEAPLYQPGMPAAEVTPAIMRELYAAIDFDEDADARDAAGPSHALSFPKEYVKTRLTFVLRSGSLELQRGAADEKKGDGNSFARMEYENLSFAVDARYGSQSVQVRLASVEVFDSKTVPGQRLSILSPAQGGDDVFAMSLDVKPLHGDTDYRVAIGMQSLNVLFCRPFIEGIADFFVKEKPNALRDLQYVAGDQFEAIRKQTAMELQAVVANKKTLELSIDVHTPNVFVPEHFDRHASAHMLMVGLGHIVFNSRLKDRQMLSDLPTLLSSLTDSSGISDVYYDEFGLHLSDINASMIQLDPNWDWMRIGEKLLAKGTSIIDPFDVKVTLYHCLVNSNHLPQFRVGGTLPALNVNVDTLEFVKFIQIWRTITADDEIESDLYADEAVVPFDEDDLVGLGEEHAVETDLTKKLMTVDFSIDTIRMLIRHDQTQAETALLTLTGFAVHYVKRPMQMDAHISLRGMVMHDRQQAYGPDFSLLATSEDTSRPPRELSRALSNVAVGAVASPTAPPSSASTAKEGEVDLITIHYRNILPCSPKYVDVDHDVELTFQRLHTFCNRSTVVNLIDSFNLIVENLSEGPGDNSDDSTDAPSSSGSPEASPSSSSGDEGEVDRTLFMRLRFRLASLQFTLNKQGERFADCYLQDMTASLELRNNDTMKAVVQLGNLRVDDLRPGYEMWSHVLHVNGTSQRMVDISYESFNKLQLVDEAEYNTLFSVSLHSMQYVYVQNFVTDVIRYFGEIRTMHSVVASSYARAAAMVAGEETLMKFVLHLDNPTIVTPRNAVCEEVLIADLGIIDMTMAYYRTDERFPFNRTSISLEAMNLKSGLKYGVVRETIVEDTNVVIVKESPKEEGYRGPLFPESSTNVTVSAIGIRASEAQLYQLYATVEENMAADYLAPDKKEAYHKYMFSSLWFDESQPKSKQPSAASSSHASPAVDRRKGKREASAHQDADVALLAASLKLRSSLAMLDGSVRDNSALPDAGEALGVPDGDGHAGVWLSSRTTVTMERLTVDLLQDSGVQPQTGEPATMFTILVHSVHIDMTTDSTDYSLYEFELERVTIEDRRYYVDNQFRYVLCPKSTNPQQVQLKYVCHPNGDTELIVNLDHPRMILLPEGVWEVWYFIWPLYQDAMKAWDLWVAWDEETELAKKNLLPEPLETTAQAESGDMKLPLGLDPAPIDSALDPIRSGQESSSDIMKAGPDAAADDAKGDWTMKITMTNPEICVVDNAENPDSRALVFKTTLLYKDTDHADGSKSIHLHAQRLEMFKCLLKNEDTAVAIVDPLDLTWKYHWNPQSRAERSCVSIEPMAVTFSYKDLKLVLSLSQQWTPALAKDYNHIGWRERRLAALQRSATKPRVYAQGPMPHSFGQLIDMQNAPVPCNGVVALDVEEDPKRKGEADVSDHEDMHDDDEALAQDMFSDDEEDYVPQVLTRDVSAPMTELPEVLSTTHDVNAGDMFIRFIDDSSELNLPVASLSLSAIEFSWQWSTLIETMKAAGGASIKVDVYNNKLQLWEPMIEPWSAMAHVSRTAESGMKVYVGAEEPLNVNLTKAALDTLLGTYEVCSRDYYDNIAAPRPPTHPFYVVNDIGVPAWYWLSDAPDNILPLDPGVQAALPVDEESKRRMRRADAQSQGVDLDDGVMTYPTISFKVLGDFKASRHWQINRLGSYVLHVDPTERTKLIYEVTNMRGSKLLRLRTNVVVENHTHVALSLLANTGRDDDHVDDGDDGLMLPGGEHGLLLQSESPPYEAVFDDGTGGAFAASEEVELPPIEPGDSLPIPMPYLIGRLRFRPVGVGCEWSRDGLPLQGLAPSSYLVLCSSSHDSRVNFVYYCMVKVPKGSSDEYHIELHPPMVIENLLGCAVQYRVELVERREVVMADDIGKGESVPLPLDMRKKFAISIKLPNYARWSKKKTITGPRVSRKIEIVDEHGGTLKVRLMRRRMPSGVTKVVFFTDAWVVNKTGLYLQYRQKVLTKMVHSPGQMFVDEDNMLVGSPDRWYDPGSEYGKPFIMSFYNSMGAKKLSFKLPGSRWCKPFLLSAKAPRLVEVTAPVPAGEASALASRHPDIPPHELRDLANRMRSYQFGVVVDRAPNQFWKTSTITIYPRYILVNQASQDIHYCQYDTNVEHLLMAESQIPWHWEDANTDQLLCVALHAEGWNWSAPFQVQRPEKFTIKTRHLDGRTHLFKIRTKIELATTLIIVEDESVEFPTYRVRNSSSETLVISQVDVETPETVRPGEAFAYSWDQPARVPRLLRVRVASNERATMVIDLDSLGQTVEHVAHNEASDAASRMLVANVIASGPTIELEVKYQSTLRHPELIQPRDEGERVLFATKVALKGIGVSFVDETPAEIMYLYMDGIALDFCDTNLTRSIDFTIEQLQVDNQMFGCIHPVVLLAEERDVPFLNLQLKISHTYKSILYISRLDAMMQDVDVRMDDTWFLTMYDFFASFSSDNAAPPDAEADMAYFTVPALNLRERAIYFDELIVHKVRAKVTFLNREGDDEGGEESKLAKILHTFGVLANIEAATVVLDGFERTNHFCLRSEFIEESSGHYTRAFVGELGKVVGHADFLGNPLSLLENVGTGFYDFLREPARGAKEGPKGFAKGVGKGTKSLVKNSVYGIFNSTSKLTGTIGNGVSALAMDEAYERERKQLARNQPKHIGEGLAYGVRDFGLGLFKGLTGIVGEPIKGARKEGLAGFFKGISRGITGLYVKPAVGTIDLVTRTTEGIKNTTTFWDDKKRARKRTPRHFGPEGVLYKYIPIRAEGQALLYGLSEGKYMLNGEYYMFHFSVGKFILLVSNVHIICVNAISLAEEWGVDIAKIEYIEYNPRKNPDGIVLHMLEYSSHNLFESPTNKRTVHCVHKGVNRSRHVYECLCKTLSHLMRRRNVVGTQ